MRTSNLLLVGVLALLCCSALGLEKHKKGKLAIPVSCAEYSVACTGAQVDPNSPGKIEVFPTCNKVLGDQVGAQAWLGAGNYTYTTGWNFEKISIVPGSVTDLTIPYAAGFLEGSTFPNQTYDLWINFAMTTAPIYPQINETLLTFLNEHTMWVWDNVAKNNSVYWQTVGWYYRYMEGMAAGYNTQNHPGEDFMFVHILLLQLQGDIWDIWSYLNFDELTPAILKERNWGNTHCSAFVKLTPDASDLYSSHTTWSGYASMNRVFKVYNFSVNEWPGKTVLQSGYPLTLPSVDDYYQITETLIMATETTLSNYNTALYKNVSPHGLFAGIRAPLANRLATTAEEWVTYMGMYNSGTYNNKWIVVDYKLFKAGQPLDPNLLWVSEQLPGYYAQDTQTHSLSYGIFPSYNMAMYPQTQVLVNMAEQVASQGVSYSYDMAPRAQIFRRDGNNAQSFEEAQTLIRYNQFETDPLSQGHGWQSIAARADLDPKTPQAFGAIDAKLTNTTLIAAGQASIISGPTHQTQPVFCWSTAKPVVQAEPHVGQPDCFDFEWLTVDQNLPCVWQP